MLGALPSILRGLKESDLHLSPNHPHTGGGDLIRVLCPPEMRTLPTCLYASRERWFQWEDSQGGLRKSDVSGQPFLNSPHWMANWSFPAGVFTCTNTDPLGASHWLTRLTDCCHSR